MTEGPIQTDERIAPKQESNNGSTLRSSSPKPSTASGTTAGGSSPALSHPRGGFAPYGLTGQVHMRNALSPQHLARISGAQTKWDRYERGVEEKQRRDESEAWARTERLSREAMRNVDCDG